MKVFIFFLVVYAAACFAEIQNTSAENASTSAETKRTRRVISRIFTRPHPAPRTQTSKLLDLIRIPTEDGVKSLQYSTEEHGNYGSSEKAYFIPYKASHSQNTQENGLSAEAHIQSHKTPYIQVTHGTETSGNSDEIAYVAPYKGIHISGSGESQNVPNDDEYAAKHETDLSGEALLKILQEYNMPHLDGASKKLRKGKLILYYDDDDKRNSPKEVIINNVPKETESIYNINTIYKDVLELFTKYGVTPGIYYKILQNAMVKGNFETGNNENIIQLLKALNKYANNSAHDDILHDIKAIVARNNKSKGHQEQQKEYIDVNRHQIVENDVDVEDIINRVLNHKTQVDIENSETDIEGSIEMPKYIYNEILQTIQRDDPKKLETVKMNNMDELDRWIDLLNDSAFNIKGKPLTEQEDNDVKSIGVEKRQGHIIPITIKPYGKYTKVAEHKILEEVTDEMNHHNYENSLEPQIGDLASAEVPISLGTHAHRIFMNTQSNEGKPKLHLSMNNNIHRTPSTKHRPTNRNNSRHGLYETDVITLKKLINYVIDDISHIDKLPPILSNKPIDEYIKYNKAKPFLIYVIFQNHNEDFDNEKPNIDDSDDILNNLNLSQEDDDEDTSDEYRRSHLSLIIEETLSQINGDFQNKHLDKTKLNKLKLIIAQILSMTYKPVTRQLITQIVRDLLSGKYNSFLDTIFDKIEPNNNDNIDEEIITSDAFRLSIKTATDKLIKNVYETLIALRRRNVSQIRIRTIIKELIEQGMLKITAQSLKICSTKVQSQIDLGIKTALQKYKVSLQ
ncbi:uncharacterized protein LOC123703845 [Colias croceus]|uniref:uncharacterized protein LOC123703845 n=1 Tax=Colias crocea TaxID=72248 RepID=UPI001E27FDD0|nr:uncharacterized protein LOC123703845 [Colias croceus]